VLKPADEEDTRKLEGYCEQFASTYVLDKGIWYEKASVLKNFPLTETELLTLGGSKTFKEFKTDGGSWFIKVGDVLKKDQPSPQQLIHDELVKAMIEKRRIGLIEKIYDKIYQDGIKSKSFEIFVK
jgi:hypothetical protein